MIARFKLGESLPRDAEAVLRGAGHDVRTVHDRRLTGSPDRTVLDACRHEDRIFVTLDLDLADVRVYPPDEHAGVWVLRPSTQGIDAALMLLRHAISLLDTEPPGNRLWIIEPGRVRIRQ